MNIRNWEKTGRAACNYQAIAQCAKYCTAFALLLFSLCANAELAVTISPLRVDGQKAVVPLAFKNDFTEKVQSARAVAFLLDEQGKVVANSTRWVIGGSKDGGLLPGATNRFFFVVTSDKPFASTNLTVKVNLTRIVMENGKVGDVSKDVQIQNATK